jgi:hypothetical protein
MPGERHQRQRRERQKSDEDRARHTDLVRDGLGEEPRKHADRPRRQPALGDVVVEIGVAHVGQHPDDVGDEHAEPDDEHGRALHVEPAETVEAGERQPDPQQRDPEGTGAEELPQRVAEIPADRSGNPDRQEREAEEQADHQRGDGAQPAARVGAHTGTGASVTRRSWKYPRTG